MSKTRQESDSLGVVNVPADALYGAQTQRAIENFDYSFRPMPKLFIMALAHIKKAAAKSNATLGELDQSIADAIIYACDILLSGEHADQFPVNVFQTGSGTSSNMNMNEVLSRLAHQALNSNNKNESVHPNDHVNLGQSSNDVIPSATQLSVAITIVDNLFPAFEKLDKQLARCIDEHQHVVKTGRTHLMDAMPLRLSDELATWQFQLNESKERIVASMARLLQLPLGGTAIGTGINCHRDFPRVVCEQLSKQCQLPIQPCSNLASRISSQDPTLEIHGQLKVLATVIMKLSNDVRWMNSGPYCGLNEWQLKALQPGSSIMPGKVNPVIAESIGMMCAEVMGNDVTLTIANQSGNFQLNVMLPLIADKTIQSIQLLSEALTAFASKLLVDFTVNKDKLARQSAQNPILVTALNPLIGYEKAAMIAKIALANQENIIDVAERETNIKREKLEQLLAPSKLANPHSEKGQQ